MELTQGGGFAILAVVSALAAATCSSTFMAATAGEKTSATSATRAAFSSFQVTPALHRGQHPSVWSHLCPRLPHPDQQHLHHLASRLQTDLCPSDWPQARVSKWFSGQPERVHLPNLSQHQDHPVIINIQATWLHALQTTPTTFNHNADNVSTLGCSLRSVFLGRGSVMTHWSSNPANYHPPTPPPLVFPCVPPAG